MGCPAARYGRPRRPCQGGRGGSPAHFRETHLLKSTRRPTRARGAGRARRDRSSPGAPAAAASEAVPGWRGGPGGRVNERKRLLTSRDAADRQSRQIVKAGGARRGAEAAGNLGRSGGGGGRCCGPALWKKPLFRSNHESAAMAAASQQPRAGSPAASRPGRAARRRPRAAAWRMAARRWVAGKERGESGAACGTGCVPAPLQMAKGPRVGLGAPPGRARAGASGRGVGGEPRAEGRGCACPGRQGWTWGGESAVCTELHG